MICIRNIHWTRHGSHLARKHQGFLFFLLVISWLFWWDRGCIVVFVSLEITLAISLRQVFVWKFSLYFSHISWKPIPLHAFKFFFFLDNTVAFPLNLCVNISASSASDNLVPYLMTLRCKDLRRKKLKDQLPIDNVLYWIIREKRR